MSSKLGASTQELISCVVVGSLSGDDDGAKLGKLGFACRLVRGAQDFDMVEKLIHGDTIVHRHISMYPD